MAVYDLQGGEERISGASLIGIFGERERIGFSKRKLKKPGKAYLKYSAPGLAYRGARRALKMSGDDVELLGAAKKKKKGGFIKTVRKVGKVTSGFTTAAAQMIGIPKSVINAAAGVDPTKKGQTVKTTVQALTPQTKEKTFLEKIDLKKVDMKKVALYGGIGVGAIVLLNLVMPRR